MSKVTKLYAAYKAGYLGENLLDTYFSFVANIIVENHIMLVDEHTIVTKLNERYTIDFPLPFIRQVLGIGLKNNCFVDDHGKYKVVIEEIEKYCFQETDFYILWNQLITAFEEYCHQINIDTPNQPEEYILSTLDDSDEIIISGDQVETDQELTPTDYAWYSFVRNQAESKTDLFSFISAISASNITRQALFYAENVSVDYSDLCVYLDSPIVFALLGMDEPVRTESYKALVKDMHNAKCSIHVLDHNFQEVDSIIARSASWATDTQYDIRKANNAARFFHDSQMNDTEIAEFCACIESKLNALGITIKETAYETYQDKSQEDETDLFDMVKGRYLEHGYALSPEREESIRVDVRSIIMVYRKRQGQTATRLQNSKHIMLTSNNAIANVSKEYESNRSIKSGHIPACISADLFGAILWMNCPSQMIEYQKLKLLADCYAFLRPNKKLLDKYIQSLDEARNSDQIDEKTFLFLRTHKIVLDSLMDITKGDYARFNSNTYLEVYEDIQAKALKKYNDEVAAHEQTKQKLLILEKESKEQKVASDQAIMELNNRLANLELQGQQQKEKQLNIKVNIWGWTITLLCVGIPYLLLSIILELFKTQLSTISWRSALGYGIATVLTVLIAIFFSKGKHFIFHFIRKKLSKGQNPS